MASAVRAPSRADSSSPAQYATRKNEETLVSSQKTTSSSRLPLVTTPSMAAMKASSSA
jgi:hypothetical protein